MHSPYPNLQIPTRAVPEPSFQISVTDRNIIEVAFIGPQTESTVNTAIMALQPYMDELRHRGHPVCLLIDNQRMNRSTIAANQRVLRAVKEIPFNKMAGINANPIVRLVVNAIIATARVGSRVKLFQDRAHAENWLLES